ncbi:unnamed protein product [Lactuca virosa]|uniref:TIR domain-containing protein n=1 Tax=Lactuca virosa TaxID=75947 RepID=A0AAU9PGM4_9ASTR|nr:unnamed protein product [Lactuca virosa]
MECNHFVLPVFYHVDPSDVRKQKNTFAIDVKACSRWTEQNVNLWKKALKEVADLAGMVLSGSESEFIAKIVDTIDYKLDLKLVSTPPHLIGMDSRTIFINSWLKNKQSGDNILAICGMGGSGKTTLAQFIYNSNKKYFENTSYLEEIGKHYKLPHGLLGLQKQLLTDILGGKNERISNVSEGTSKVEAALQKKRAFIVLDDIDEHDECLLSISSSKKLVMHQLLQEMGRKIVLEESKDPSKHSRVSQNYESYRLLGKGKGSETIEGLALDVRKLEQGMRSNPLALKTDMSFGNLKKFEPPMVLHSLKILNLKESHKLVSIHNLSRLPNLETLILWNCGRLTHVCETIECLESLSLLDFTGCTNLWKVSSNKKPKSSCTGGGIPRQSFSLPDSLKFLFLNDCNLENNNDIPLFFSGQPFFYLNLGNNLLEVLPNNINLKMLRVLELTSCPKLKSLLCLPSTLEELYTYRCFSLEKITFESARFKLRKFVYRDCNKVSEIQGLFKLVSIEKLHEVDLGHMKWIKAYQDREVDLVGDEITRNRKWHIQVLYEYGIMNTYLPGIIDQSITASEYRSLSPNVSFRVPSCPKKQRIQGLQVTALYRPSGQDEDIWVLFTKISNTTKGLTWMYNPVVYCQPGVGEDAVWISYWPIGNILDTGDEVNVSIIVGNGLNVTECGASLVFIDDGEVEKESCEHHMKEEEVIGGDLSEFELTTKGYYLCRRDFFKSTTLDWVKVLLGDPIPYTELLGWRKSRPTQYSIASFMELETFRGSFFSNMKEIVLKIDSYSRTKEKKMLKALSAVHGVNSVMIDIKRWTVTVSGDVDAVDVAICAKKIKDMHIISNGSSTHSRGYTYPFNDVKTEGIEMISRKIHLLVLGCVWICRR